MALISLVVFGLFLIFINDFADIFSELKVTLKLFADNVKL